MKVYTVSQVNRYIKKVIENDFFLSELYIEAEISNFKVHSSGHIYFTLKDSGASINAVMFKSNAEKLKFVPENGIKVIANGYISLYEKTGQYQIYVSSLEVAGVGGLYLAFEQLKARLEKAGVFDQKHKKAIPTMPKTVAVITSPTGAAIRDIINVAGRRNPNVELVVVPTLVQGENAGSDIVKAIDKVNRWGKADVIILGRGGGSIEDLWAFNEEIVARAIFKSEIPIISAVGHETDFTIADFIADLRAPTPSAAAEIAVPEGNSINQKVISYYDKINKSMVEKINEYNSRFKVAQNSYGFRGFYDLIRDNQIYINKLSDRLYSRLNHNVVENKLRLKNCIDNIENKSPLNLLKKGYLIVCDENEKVIKSKNDVKVGDKVSVKADDGSFRAEVIEVDWYG